MPSEDIPVCLNKSDFWVQNFARESVRASNSFRVPPVQESSRSILYTDAELADLLSKLPLSRQRLSFPNRSLLHSSSDANSIPLSMPAANSTTHRDFCRTSRSVEREVFRNELNFIESNEADLWNEMRIRRQTNLVMLNQRNQLMKINEGLAKYIAHNSK